MGQMILETYQFLVSGSDVLQHNKAQPSCIWGIFGLLFTKPWWINIWECTYEEVYWFKWRDKGGNELRYRPFCKSGTKGAASPENVSVSPEWNESRNILWSLDMWSNREAKWNGWPPWTPEHHEQVGVKSWQTAKTSPESRCQGFMVGVSIESTFCCSVQCGYMTFWLLQDILFRAKTWGVDVPGWVRLVKTKKCAISSFQGYLYHAVKYKDQNMMATFDATTRTMGCCVPWEPGSSQILEK